MPELPEVETVKNGIAQFAGKAEIVDVTVRNRRLRSVVPDGFETAVRGAKIKEYRRKGKYIVIDLDNGRSIIWHLGMSGRVKTVKSNAAPEEKQIIGKFTITCPKKHADMYRPLSQPTM